MPPALSDCKGISHTSVSPHLHSKHGDQNPAAGNRACVGGGPCIPAPCPWGLSFPFLDDLDLWPWLFHLKLPPLPSHLLRAGHPPWAKVGGHGAQALTPGLSCILPASWPSGHLRGLVLWETGRAILRKLLSWSRRGYEVGKAGQPGCPGPRASQPNLERQRQVGEGTEMLAHEVVTLEEAERVGDKKEGGRERGGKKRTTGQGKE